MIERKCPLEPMPAHAYTVTLFGLEIDALRAALAGEDDESAVQSEADGLGAIRLQAQLLAYHGGIHRGDIASTEARSDAFLAPAPNGWREIEGGGEPARTGDSAEAVLEAMFAPMESMCERCAERPVSEGEEAPDGHGHCDECADVEGVQ